MCVCVVSSKKNKNKTKTRRFEKKRRSISRRSCILPIHDFVYTHTHHIYNTFKKIYIYVRPSPSKTLSLTLRKIKTKRRLEKKKSESKRKDVHSAPCRCRTIFHEITLAVSSLSCEKIVSFSLLSLSLYNSLSLSLSIDF